MSKMGLDVNDKFGKKKSKSVKIRKYWLYLLVFLLIAIPIVVGILVWHFVSEAKVIKNDVEDTKTTQQSRTDEEYTATEEEILFTEPPTTVNPHIGKVWDFYRLPRDVVPEHYHITLYPDFYGNNTLFSGSEVIEIDVINSTNLIIIHYKDINITNMAIVDISSGESKSANNTFSYHKYDYLVMEFSEALESGTRLNMTFEFRGVLGDDTTGFFKSSYTTSTDEKRNVVSTYLEPSSAREVFPCFDEPDMKANFTITLIHRSNYTALSNMPEEGKRPSAEYADAGSDLVATRFMTSVRMSTYLVCVIVCDFDHIENVTRSGHLVRAWAPSESIHHMYHFLDITTSHMDFLQDYFDIPYQLPKLDIIAIPAHSGSRGMENWGLVTILSSTILPDPNETSLRPDPKENTIWYREFTERTLPTMLVYNWNGNLATVGWWNHIWLHTGLTTFVGLLALDAVNPDLEVMTHSPFYLTQWAMEFDAHDNSHPIISPETESRSEFILYVKAAYITRMMWDFMGDDNFKEALRIYVQENAWKNTKTDDLWSAFSKIDGFSDIKTIMDTWTLQMGFPYIDVTYQYDDQKNVTVVEANQQRFMKDPQENITHESPYNYTWYVPLRYVTSDETEDKQTIWMNRTAVTFELPVNVSDESTWIKFNPRLMGFYRVKYPDEMWRRLTAALKANVNVLKPEDRLGLLQDAFLLAEAGHISYITALDLTTYMQHEHHGIPWTRFHTRISKLKSVFYYREEGRLFEKYIISIAKPFADKLGWEPKAKGIDGIAQLQVHDLMCAMGEAECLRKASVYYRQWFDNKTWDSVVNLEIANTYGMREGGTDDNWDELFMRYLNDDDFVKRDQLTFSLTQSSSLPLLNKLLSLALNESMFGYYDILNLCYYMKYNPYGRHLIWTWFRANWQNITDRFDDKPRHLNFVVYNVVEDFNTSPLLKEVESFLEEHRGTDVIDKSRSKILDRINNNIKWMDEHYDGIVAWLKEHVNSAAIQ